MPTRYALDADRAVSLFHALSDPILLSIMELLRGGVRCVCDLQDDLETAQSKLSFHLKVLKDAGLVSDRREGRWSYYTIVPEALAEVHDLTVGMTPKKGTLPLLMCSPYSTDQNFLLSEGMMTTLEEIRATVQARYGATAQRVLEGATTP